MLRVKNPSRHLYQGTSVICLTNAQRVLWQFGLPILDRNTIARHKTRAKLVMLWRAIRWQLVGIAALVAFECLGRDWPRTATVGGAAVALATLFTWLVSVADLQWASSDYASYRREFPVPARVSAVADELVRAGIQEKRIRVEYLKDDPILFVEESDDLSAIRRYDLMVW